MATYEETPECVPAPKETLTEQGKRLKDAIVGLHNVLKGVDARIDGLQADLMDLQRYVGQ